MLPSACLRLGWRVLGQEAFLNKEVQGRAGRRPLTCRLHLIRACFLQEEAELGPSSWRWPPLQPPVPGAHLPLLKFRYLGDAHSGRTAKGFLPAHLCTCSFPSPTRPIPSGLPAWRICLLQRPSCQAWLPCLPSPTPPLHVCTVPVPPGTHLSQAHLTPAPLLCMRLTHPRGWGRTAAAYPSCRGGGVGAEEEPWGVEVGGEWL